jgi:hypothetical protein
VRYATCAYESMMGTLWRAQQRQQQENEETHLLAISFSLSVKITGNRISFPSAFLSTLPFTAGLFRASILARLYRSYKSSDPKEKQEKAIPSCILILIANNNTTELRQATTQLIIGAFFFACRSCEYLKVKSPENKRTRQLTLKNISFRKNGELLHHSAPMLHSAESVSITFELQKNDRKNDTITQWATSHEILCPVKQWAALVTRIRAYTNTNDDTPVSTIRQHNRLEHVTATHVTSSLRDAISTYGPERLRIAPSEVGTHSIRSGAAMAMYLGGVPVFAIMMIGRWSSDAFMKYIRKQIEEFTYDVSSKMLTMQQFRHTHYHTTTDSRATEYGGSATLMLS